MRVLAFWGPSDAGQVAPATLLGLGALGLVGADVKTGPKVPFPHLLQVVSVGDGLGLDIQGPHDVS